MWNLSVRERLFCWSRTLLPALGLFFALLVSGQYVLASAPPLAEDSDSADSPEEAAEELIVVTATRLPQPKVQIPAPVEVIQAENIAAAGARNLGEAVRLAGNAVVVSSGGPGAVTSIRLQGAAATQVQVLVDGRAINNGLASVDLSRIPLPDVERIEIVKGPVSSLYGANALGGVINVITRQPAGRTSEAGFTVGSFGERRFTFSAGDGRGAVGYLVTGDFLGTDGWRPNSDLASQALSGRIGWRAGGGEVTLRAGYAKTSGGSPGGNGEYDTWVTPTSRYSDETANLDWTYQSAAAHNLMARAYLSSEIYDYQDPFTPGHHQAAWQGAEARATAQLGAHQVVFGGEYRQDASESTHLSESRTSRNLALYVEDLWQTGPWSLTWGGRLDYHSAYGDVLSPRFGVVRSLSPKTRLWLSAARAFRAPSFEDLYWKDGGGNPDLRPETGRAYQAGIRSGGLDLSVFHKDVQDNINWSNASGGWRVENLNATRFDGYEVTYQKDLGAGLSATAAYARLFAVDLEQDRPLSYRPAYQGSLSLSAKLPGEWQGVLSARSVGPQWAEVWDVVASKTRQVEAPGYTVVDLSATRAVTPRFGYQISLKNALDAEYQENPGFPMPGRALTAEATFRF